MDNNNYFIINMMERVINGDTTLFLNNTELKKVTNLLNREKIKYDIYYPYPDSEKAIVYSTTPPDISLLEIKSKKELKHSDILGSLYGSNITPNNYEIVIMDGKYYLIVLNKLLKFFLTQFRQVGRVNIEVDEVDLDLIKDYQVCYEELNFLCSSLRIDSVVSSITNLSRKSALDLIKDDHVLLNYEVVKRFKIIEEGDILSIRKYGKYKFNRILRQNKKGKKVIEILKYK